jgi:Calcineurin-like phosphoesterase superfamily domain
MKKLLILSDIHANWPALEAVLHNEGSWDGVAFCGDVVGVGPQPVECVRWVAEHAEFRVRGDLDNALAFGLDGDGAGSFREASPITRTWLRRLLAPVDVAFLRSLPTIDWFEWDGSHFRISHVTPQGNLLKYFAPYEQARRVRVLGSELCHSRPYLHPGRAPRRSRDPGQSRQRRAEPRGRRESLLRHIRRRESDPQTCDL